MAVETGDRNDEKIGDEADRDDGQDVFPAPIAGVVPSVAARLASDQGAIEHRASTAGERKEPPSPPLSQFALQPMGPARPLFGDAGFEIAARGLEPDRLEQ